MRLRKNESSSILLVMVEVGGSLIKDSKFVHIRDVFLVGALRNKFNRHISKVPNFFSQMGCTQSKMSFG